MKKLTTAINYLLVQPDELPPAEQALVQKAIDATNNSYARYSNFHVGAACLLETEMLLLELIRRMQHSPLDCVLSVQPYLPHRPIIPICLSQPLP